MVAEQSHQLAPPKGEHMDVATDDLIGLDDAARLARVHRETLRRRLVRAGAPLWLDPSDHRRRLIRRTDLEAMTAPRLISRDRREGRAA